MISVGAKGALEGRWWPREWQWRRGTPPWVPSWSRYLKIHPGEPSKSWSWTLHPAVVDGPALALISWQPAPAPSWHLSSAGWYPSPGKKAFKPLPKCPGAFLSLSLSAEVPQLWGTCSLEPPCSGPARCRHYSYNHIALLFFPEFKKMKQRHQCKEKTMDKMGVNL